MESAQERRKPWKSWSEFTAWAQDFSLRKKVVGGFLGVVVLVGLVTAFIGTRLVRDTIIDRAQVRLSSDLATAGFILDGFRKNVELKVRLIAGSENIKELMSKGDLQGVRNRLAIVCAENDLDFLSIADKNGRVLVRAFVPSNNGEIVAGDPLVMAAAKGSGGSGVRLFTKRQLAAENNGLLRRLAASSSETGMVLESAYPLVDSAGIDSVVYGGVVLNSNNLIGNQVSQLIFKGATYGNRPLGYVAIFQANQAISSSLKGPEGLPLMGFAGGAAIRKMVEQEGLPTIAKEVQLGKTYLSTADPLRDMQGGIVGALEIATLEEPIISEVDRLVTTFFIVALFGVLLMAGISYFLVQWINRPLELMLNAARKAAEGDLTQQVPVIARDEVGELAATFNLMIRSLAESRIKLEEWGRELASKVAEKTGQLRQAQEQVARVKKLASLEKMADGMSHIMRHISDPMVPVLAGTEAPQESATNRILVLDSDEKVRELCERAFTDEGFQVRVTGLVEEALRELEQEFFDVVVADVDISEMPGKTLLKEIKYRQPEVLVIFTAPFKATEEAIEAVNLGAYDYIPKPFGPHQILLMVYTALQTQRMVQQTRRQLAAERADTIFQRLPVAIALADKAHRVVYNNRAFVELATRDGQEQVVKGKTFNELFGVDPLDWAKGREEAAGSRWLELEKVGRTAKLYNFKLPEEDLRVLMLLDITDTVKKDQMADVFKAETITKAQQVIHQQMRVAQEIAQLLGETTAETKAALFELMKLAQEVGEGK